MRVLVFDDNMSWLTNLERWLVFTPIKSTAMNKPPALTGCKTVPFDHVISSLIKDHWKLAEFIKTQCDYLHTFLCIKSVVDGEIWVENCHRMNTQEIRPSSCSYSVRTSCANQLRRQPVPLRVHISAKHMKNWKRHILPTSRDDLYEQEDIKNCLECHQIEYS
jgi:hypothetical protein